MGSNLNYTTKCYETITLKATRFDLQTNKTNTDTTQQTQGHAIKIQTKTTPNGETHTHTRIRE